MHMTLFEVALDEDVYDRQSESELMHVTFALACFSLFDRSTLDNGNVAMDDILHGLNPAQRAAVTSPSSVLQVLAPPGSGKTKTLTARVAWLIAHKQLKPWNIITCTFTKKAAKEMKERIRGFVGEELSKQIRLGTFHAIAVQYLRQYGQHIGLEKDFGIADASDSKAILKRIIKKGEFTIEPGQALGRISAQKVKGLGSDHMVQKAKNIEQQEFARVFAEYEAELKASNLLDYDDLLLRCCFLMRTHPQCVSNVEAVLIDEFQDTNSTQYELMGLFAQRRNAITIVGDPDQSIYGFRSAEIENLARMRRQWPDTLTINLQENYRSSGAILHAAQNIIEQDKSRPPKKLQATHSPGQRPVLRKLPTAAAEASWLVSEIERIRALTGDMLQPSDFAILLRSAALSRVIEAALGKEGVPYRMVGGMKFFERAEVKLIIDYLRAINQPNNSEAVERIVNVPARRIGDATVKGLREEASAKNVSLWNIICDAAQGRVRPSTKVTAAAEKGLAAFMNVILTGQRRLASLGTEQTSLVGIINLIIKKLDLQTYLKNKYENEHEVRWSNVEELIAQAADASNPERLKATMEEDALPTVEGLDQRTPSNEDALSIFLANIALTTSAEEKTAEGTEPVQQVTISTIHSAKGLEWPVVFIPACYEGSIPHSRSDDNDEERRLLYVGMTRAQAMLYLSCPIKNTQREETIMSSYLIQPGVTSFFEEHGPSMSSAAVKGLAATLKRALPSEDALSKTKTALERDEDNYWPVNGEEPPEERAKWNYGKADNALPAFGTTRPAPCFHSAAVTMQQQQGFSTASATIASGFVSVKAKYDELLEQTKLEAIDKRADARKKSDTDAPKGRKRQIDGQGSIAGFFAKKRQPSPGARTEPNDPIDRAHEPLRDISNLNKSDAEHSLSIKARPTVSHMPRTAALRKVPPPQPPSSDDAYVFLSSSPPQPENQDQENQPSDTVLTDISEDSANSAQPQYKPASTLHMTSLQSLHQPSAPRGKRYGVRPSFNGWANRANK
ncbi:ATP-dependent DNA helicase srs2 [Vermiconidia calcicola]|uniref:ATP-dependent DNA helicase srs2 n=1 Tax=Vermiconidia calcicola TaxID=1690605 RepID=A0ACC3MBZ8_9PEZI|nr:ATP-dependent DNA helicase srs2 [Vermiconidia calcicola]